MADMMAFPETVEEYMEQYKITDTKHVYTNGVELVPIFRMKQWFDHKSERKTGKWGEHGECPFCGYLRQWEDDRFCGNCGARMVKEGE